jgi:hypothetical protein
MKMRILAVYQKKGSSYRFPLPLIWLICCSLGFIVMMSYAVFADESPMVYRPRLDLYTNTSFMQELIPSSISTTSILSSTTVQIHVPVYRARYPGNRFVVPRMILPEDRHPSGLHFFPYNTPQNPHQSTTWR